MPTMIVANLLHLSYNMWGDWENPAVKSKYWCARPYLRFDEKLWNDLLVEMAKRKFNMVVIDLGDGVQYDSHPEIPVKGAWSPAKLRSELKKMRDMGLEPIPKMNFSACHDQWLGKYNRMVSTPEYYQVVSDLIAEGIDLFDKPRFFHLGMDEEEPQHQENFQYVVCRRFDLWWKDILSLFDHVNAKGVRPWIWSDYVWNHTDEFYKRMPKTVMQSNWYRDPVRGPAKSVYGSNISMDVECCKTYVDLDKAGYDQIPTVSNWETPANIPNTINFCQQHCSKDHLKGYILTPWKPTLEEVRDRHMDAIEHMALALADLK
jgi:hypothetical protein